MDESADESPRISAPDYIELVCLLVFFAVGAPLNLAAYQGLAQRKPASKTSCSSRIHRLKRHLNISDLMVLLLFCPVRVCWLLTYSWRGGGLLCRVLHFTNALSFQSGSNIIVCIALDRLLSVMCPRTGSKSCKRVKLMLIVAWSLALLTSLPAMFLHATYSPWEGWDQCVTIWAKQKHTVLTRMFHSISELKSNYPVHNTTAMNSSDYETLSQLVHSKIMTMADYSENRSTPELIYLGFHLLVLFWLPLFIIAISYTLVAVWLCRLTLVHTPVPESTSGRAQSTINDSTLVYCNMKSTAAYTNGNAGVPLVNDTNGHCMPSRDHQVPFNTEADVNSPRSSLAAPPRLSVIQVSNVRRVKRNAIRISALLVGAYVLCWTPYNIMALYQFYDYITYQKHVYLLYSLNMLVVLNSVINPVLYGMLGTVKRFTRSG